MHTQKQYYKSTHIETYTHTQNYTDTHTHTCRHTHSITHTHTETYTDIHTDKHTYTSWHPDTELYTHRGLKLNYSKQTKHGIHSIQSWLICLRLFVKGMSGMYKNTQSENEDVINTLYLLLWIIAYINKHTHTTQHNTTHT
jgi:hypothetical protein